jgi:excinuclease ABC subunit C
LSLLTEKVQNLPAQPGVYLFKDRRGRVLYVGKAKRLLNRVRSYLSGDNAHPRLRELMGLAADVDVIVTDSEAEALLLESTLVRQHEPHFNVRLKDDKSFPYVKISVQEEWPRVSITRQVRTDGARYFGPYTDVKTLRRTLRQIRRVFPVRSCADFEQHRRQDRPCLFFHIRRCVGPCYSRAAVRPDEYRQLVEGLILYLSGRGEDLERRLRREMDGAAEGRRYELAAQRRDQLALLAQSRSPQHMLGLDARDADVVGMARHGRDACAVVLLVRDGRVVGKETRFLRGADQASEERLLTEFLAQRYLGPGPRPARLVLGRTPEERDLLAQALGPAPGGRAVELHVPQRGRERALLRSAERNAAVALEDRLARRGGRRARHAPAVLDLQRALSLAEPPHRIVCFDVANLGGDQAVAAAVAGEDGKPRKALYRRMRMRTAGPDDFAMIHEAVNRYFGHVHRGDWPRPDLVMVDGGAGQVSAARAALTEAGEARLPVVGLAKREERIHREQGPPLVLPRRSPALRLLQQLRDEAHRFGNVYHRGLRSRARVRSALDSVPGVGPARRAAMLRAFGSVAALRDADPAEVARRAHLSAGLAERVVAHLRDLSRSAG